MAGTKRGIYIAIDGIDGCGKTTQIRLFEEDMAKKFRLNFSETTDLSYGPIGTMVRKKYLNGSNESTKTMMSYLYAADRLSTVKTINSHLDRCCNIISDRSYLSAYAYDNYHDILDDCKYIENPLDGSDTAVAEDRSYFRNKISQGIAHTMMLNDELRSTCMPDLIFYIDCPATVAIKRIKERATTNDIYEDEGKLRAIKMAYRIGIEMEKEQPNHPKIFILDGKINKEELHDRIMVYTEYVLKERHII